MLSTSHKHTIKQTMLLDGGDIGLLKQRICGRGLHLSFHEGMKDISNVKVPLKSGCGNVNIDI